MKTLLRSLLSTICVIIVSWALYAQPASAPVSSDPSAALLAQDQAWADAIRGDLTTALSFWDNDATFYRHGLPVLHGVKEIGQTIKKTRETPGFSIARTPKHAQISSSGDLGYTTGEYTRTVPGEDGNVSTYHGNYMCVWKKGSTGWKCISAMATRDH